MCDFINAHEDLIQITTFGEYRDAMRRVMKVIKEAHNVEKKRRQTSRKRKREEVTIKTQRAKALIFDIRRGQLRKEEIERKPEGYSASGAVERLKMRERVRTEQK